MLFNLSHWPVFHSLNYGMFDLAQKYEKTGMPAFVDLQELEFAAVANGFSAVRHQRESVPVI